MSFRVPRRQNGRRRGSTLVCPLEPGRRICRDESGEPEAGRTSCGSLKEEARQRDQLLGMYAEEMRGPYISARQVPADNRQADAGRRLAAAQHEARHRRHHKGEAEPDNDGLCRYRSWTFRAMREDLPCQKRLRSRQHDRGHRHHDKHCRTECVVDIVVRRGTQGALDRDVEDLEQRRQDHRPHHRPVRPRGPDMFGEQAHEPGRRQREKRSRCHELERLGPDADVPHRALVDSAKHQGGNHKAKHRQSEDRERALAAHELRHEISRAKPREIEQLDIRQTHPDLLLTASTSID